MQVLRSSQALNSALDKLRLKKRTVGFVPTMGYLHEGHLSLVRRSKRENDVTVVSLFVNPLQFGPKEDLKRYPRNEAGDKRLLTREKVDILFMPKAEALYAKDFDTTVKVDKLSQPLCGKSRPVHFRGVATIVLKLINLVRPTILYLGQKDYQQFRVIEKMVEDLDLSVRVTMVPTVREKDGLAMSSRNVYLSKVERQEATVLHKALMFSAHSVKRGEKNVTRLKANMRKILSVAKKFRLDYLEIVDARSLEPVVRLAKNQRVVAAVAGFFGKTRLIDNSLMKG